MYLGQLKRMLLFLFLLLGMVLPATGETSGGWIKYENNPVLGGNLGVCFDITMIKENNLYKMWFSWRPKKAIGYTESTDGIHWKEPVVVLEPAGDWELDLNRPSVVYKDKMYHIWYTGQTKKNSKVGYAVSKDGIHWERKQKEPVLVPEENWEKVAIMCPHVLWDATEKQFKMWYSAGEQYEPNAIGYATSSDGLLWKKYVQNPVFKADPDSTWEKHKVTAAQLLFHKGWYYIFYIGFENEYLARIGIARSRNGLDHWEKLPANPIISPDKGCWDSDACYKPFVLFDVNECRWRLWYNGRKTHVEQIGMAYHDGEDPGFLEDNEHSNFKPVLLKMNDYCHYIDEFNKNDEETIKQIYPNRTAWEFLSHNIPFLDYPDKELERIYYFRWWTFRKHLKQTDEGHFIITEFHPPVSWAGKENAICCPAGHHFREGRWLHNERILDDYGRFWLLGGGALRSYSFWIADSFWQRALVTGRTNQGVELLDDLVKNYGAWEKERRDPNGFFWQTDNRDGMEISIGGSGYRVTINTYMYADATAIGRFAELAGRTDLKQTYFKKAEDLKTLINTKLWDSQAQFYKVAPRVKQASDPILLQKVREEHGYTPWYADNAKIPLPEYTAAWKQLMDPKGFYAPFGPTTAEQRHPEFKITYIGHECQWNGPSWPFSTSITLTALGNLIYRDSLTYRDTEEWKKAFRDTLKIYTHSHYRLKENGTLVPWIDENLNPFTGEWLARTRLKSMGWQPRLGGYERGKDYNHSTFCDLVINGLIGIRPRIDNSFDFLPLVDPQIEYFCLDNVLLHQHLVTIFYDKTGTRYQKGVGLYILIDGKERIHLEQLPKKPVRVEL